MDGLRRQNSKRYFASKEFRFQAFKSCFIEYSTQFSLYLDCVLPQCSFWVDALSADCLKILVFRSVEANWEECLARLHSLLRFGSRIVLV